MSSRITDRCTDETRCADGMDPTAFTIFSFPETSQYARRRSWRLNGMPIPDGATLEATGDQVSGFIPLVDPESRAICDMPKEYWKEMSLRQYWRRLNQTNLTGIAPRDLFGKD